MIAVLWLWFALLAVLTLVVAALLYIGRQADKTDRDLIARAEREALHRKS